MIMTGDMKKWIEKLTENIREVYDLHSPLDFDSFIKELGGEYEEIDDWVQEEAVIEKTKEDSFIIRLQANKPERRKRFSIAHELGHLFIHMGYRLDDEKWQKFNIGEGFPRFGNSEQERETHYFAASLMMPADEFRKACEENSGKNSDGKKVCHLQKVADVFQVSNDAALDRGKALGIFAW
jgi:Zn-dependent peptidase ImmA (M78 family)